jgi:imidazolonepropionase-like amidohydrolase
MVLFIAQALLVTLGKTRWHRRVGVAGAFFAVVILVSGTVTAIVAARHGNRGNPPGPLTPVAFLLAATLRDMAKRGIFYVPTIDHNRYYAQSAAIFGYDSAAVARLDAYRARNMDTLRRAIKMDVPVAMGSDALFSMFGQNTRELLWFVEAGMKPGEALEAATTNGAAVLGMDKDLGAVAPGYFADIVAVDGDPLADIGAVVNGVRWVMKGGAVVVDRTGPGN